MSGVRCHSIQEEEESSSKSGVVLSITPRLQRYFADPKVAKLLRWHADREKKKREEQLESKQRLIKPFCFGYSSSGLFSSKVLKQAFLLKTEFRVS